jgi:hypothetical protein
MRAKEFTSNSESKERFVEMFNKFLPLAMHYLKLDSLPKMVFKKSIGDVHQPTFGMFVNEKNTLYVALANRHPNDILRTVAHELQHYKQNTEHKLHDKSGVTGSPEENEANAMAGIVMRHFNKKYPEFLKDRPVIAESAVTDLEKDLKNPTGYDAIDHMMKAIAKKHGITPKQLHDKFVEKHGKIPDEWIA